MSSGWRNPVTGAFQILLYAHKITWFSMSNIPCWAKTGGEPSPAFLYSFIIAHSFIIAPARPRALRRARQQIAQPRADSHVRIGGEPSRRNRATRIDRVSRKLLGRLAGICHGLSPMDARDASLPPDRSIRAATAADCDALAALEARVFAHDRISRRAFGHLTTRANAAVLVAVDGGGGVCGGAVVLLRKGSRRARLYSIAVAPGCQGKGLGRVLLGAAEAAACARGAGFLRLEVRCDAPAVQAFYRRHGYRPYGSRPGYYEDGAAALCMEKPLSAAAAGGARGQDAGAPRPPAGS